MVEKKNLRIVYMGTPDFAVEALRCLVEGGYNVVGVITMPDKPAGRGHKLQFSPVKQYALEHNLPLLQPEKLKDEAFVEALRAWKADLQIGEPEVRHNGDVNISLRVQGSQHYRVFEWVMTLYHDSNQCSVQANKVYMAGNYSFKGRILPLPEK